MIITNYVKDKGLLIKIEGTSNQILNELLEIGKIINKEKIATKREILFALETGIEEIKYEKIKRNIKKIEGDFNR